MRELAAGFFWACLGKRLFFSLASVSDHNENPAGLFKVREEIIKQVREANSGKLALNSKQVTAGNSGLGSCSNLLPLGFRQSNKCTVRKGAYCLPPECLPRRNCMSCRRWNCSSCFHKHILVLKALCTHTRCSRGRFHWHFKWFSGWLRFQSIRQKRIFTFSAIPVEKGRCKHLSQIIKHGSERAGFQLWFWFLAAALSSSSRHNFAVSLYFDPSNSPGTLQTVG